MKPITFQKLSEHHLTDVWNWLEEPHVTEFWDNSQEHKDDIINFTHGRQTPSSYCGGEYVYWIAYTTNVPFAMMMSIRETYASDICEEKKESLSKTGNTYSLDMMIGNVDSLGKGFASQTLIVFIDFLRKDIDPKADTFLIDPVCTNKKAIHIYEKAGFDYATDFVMDGDYSGSGQRHFLFVKKF